MFPNELTDIDARWLENTFGRRTINEIRAEQGIAPVVGGDMAYADWVKREMNYPLRPTLKILRRPQDTSRESGE